MSFRKMQNLKEEPFIPTMILRESIGENGFVDSAYVDSRDQVLPDAEKFDFEKCMKAGVNLEEINTKIL